MLHRSHSPVQELSGFLVVKLGNHVVKEVNEVALYVKIDDLGSLKITHEASSSRVSREGFNNTT